MLFIDGLMLGKKLKEARLRKKMTQSDVVGDFITRNMLSQIESGIAFPSVKTLEYLCRVLEMPLNSIMPDVAETANKAGNSGGVNGGGALPGILDTLLCGKTHMRAENYDSVIRLVTPLLENPPDNGETDILLPPPLADEAWALLARAYLGKAKKHAAEKNIGAAITSAKKASEYALSGVYASRDIRTGALLLLDELSEEL